MLEDLPKSYPNTELDLVVNHFQTLWNGPYPKYAKRVEATGCKAVTAAVRRGADHEWKEYASSPMQCVFPEGLPVIVSGPDGLFSFLSAGAANNTGRIVEPNPGIVESDVQIRSCEDDAPSVHVTTLSGSESCNQVGDLGESLLNIVVLPIHAIVRTSPLCVAR